MSALFWSSEQPEQIMCVVVGDKRVGKDTLLDKYAKRMVDKRGDEEEGQAVSIITSNDVK